VLPLAKEAILFIYQGKQLKCISKDGRKEQSPLYVPNAAEL
jgi:hypothetical protein